MGLLAFLALQQGRSATRARAAALLWEDAEHEQARLHLRKALWHIRTETRRIQPDASLIETFGDTLTLSNAVAVDAAQFSSAVDRSRLDPEALGQACEAYGAELLGNFHLRNAPAFDEWAAAKRQQFHDLALDCFARLAEHHVGQPSGAKPSMHAANRLLALDPLQERGHRILMRGYQRQGQGAAAVQQYRKLRDLLHRELGVDPDAETQSLYHSIQVGRRPAAAEQNRSSAPARRAALANSEAIAVLEGEVQQERRVSRANVRAWAAAGIVVAAGAGVYAAWAAQPDSPHIARIFPVVTGLTVVGHPDLAPDGKQLIVTARDPSSETDQLFVLPTSGGSPTRLTNGQTTADYASWSPDGRSIAYLRSGTPGSQWQIIIRTLAGGRERSLGSVSSPGPIGWSPTGDRIIFADSDGPGSTTHLATVRLTDGARQTLTRPGNDGPGDRLPIFSTDGGTIVFARASSRQSGDLMALDLASGQVSALTKDSSAIYGLALDPKREAVLFTSDRGGDAGLWWVPLKGGEPQRVSEGLLRYRGLDGTAGNGTFLFEGVRDRSGLRFSTATSAAGENDFRAWSPDVARDGTTAYVSTRSGGQQLWLMSKDGRSARLTNVQGWHILDPRWSPDGRRIAFVGVIDGQADIYTVGRTGGSPKRLTNDRAEEWDPAWSSDGRQLLFVSRRAGTPAIFRISAEGRTEPRMVLPAVSDLRSDPIGGGLYFSDLRRTGIFRLRPEGPVKIMSGTVSRGWAPWKGELFFMRQSGEPPMIQAFEPATIQLRNVAGGSGLHMRSPFAVRPDGTLLLNTQTYTVELYGLELTK